MKIDLPAAVNETEPSAEPIRYAECPRCGDEHPKGRCPAHAD